MSDLELVWLAGYLEGEGSFLKGTPSQPNMPWIAVVTTDEDVAKKVSAMLGVSYCIAGEKRRKSHWKRAYKIHKRGREAVAIMNHIKPMMSFRRQLQIEHAVQGYPEKPRKPGRQADELIVRQIREATGTRRQIAERFGVDQSTVSRIKNRISYQELE